MRRFGPKRLCDRAAQVSNANNRCHEAAHGVAPRRAGGDVLGDRLGGDLDAARAGAAGDYKGPGTSSNAEGRAYFANLAQALRLTGEESAAVMRHARRVVWSLVTSYPRLIATYACITMAFSVVGTRAARSTDVFFDAVRCAVQIIDEYSNTAVLEGTTENDSLTPSHPTPRTPGVVPYGTFT